jgi:hypothetical protein
MATLFTFGIKQPDGSYQNYTGELKDQTDKFGQNVVIYEQQTKEERTNKVPKKYFANGKVFWTDGKVTLAEKTANKKETPF